MNYEKQFKSYENMFYPYIGEYFSGIDEMYDDYLQFKQDLLIESQHDEYIDFKEYLHIELEDSYFWEKLAFLSFLKEDLEYSFLFTEKALINGCQDIYIKLLRLCLFDMMDSNLKRHMMDNLEAKLADAEGEKISFYENDLLFLKASNSQKKNKFSKDQSEQFAILYYNKKRNLDENQNEEILEFKKKRNQRIFKTNEINNVYWISLYKLFIYGNYYCEALLVMQENLKENFNYSNLIRKAFALTKLELYDDALELYDYIINNFPDDGDVLNRKNQLLDLMNEK